MDQALSFPLLLESNLWMDMAYQDTKDKKILEIDMQTSEPSPSSWIV